MCTDAYKTNNNYLMIYTTYTQLMYALIRAQVRIFIE